jgi:hypothetical protein
MLIRELFENNAPGMYVYHASYLPDQAAGLKSVLTKGLQPSKDGYAGPGVYFAYDPEGGYYHVSKEEATLFRVKWSALVAKFGVYPDNENGIQRDDDEIIVPGVVPANMLEVEYFPGEWWDLNSAYYASLGPVDESNNNNIVRELFQPGKKWQWSFTGSEEAVAVFDVGGIPYQFYAYTYSEDPTRWEVEFKNATRGAEQGRTSKFGLTGTGNSAEVMSTIADIMREFLSRYSGSITELTFTADEPSRRALYARMAKRLLPDWEVIQSGKNFTLSAPVDPSQ